MHGFEPLHVAPDEHDGRAVRGTGNRQRLADAARRPGDGDDAARELIGTNGNGARIESSIHLDRADSSVSIAGGATARASCAMGSIVARGASGVTPSSGKRRACGST